MIPQHIPTDYLEGYNKLLAKAKMLKWPKNPKAIFTSNSYSCCLYDLKKYASEDYCIIDYSLLFNDYKQTNKMLNDNLYNIGLEIFDYNLDIVDKKYRFLDNKNSYQLQYEKYFGWVESIILDEKKLTTD